MPRWRRRGLIVAIIGVSLTVLVAIDPRVSFVLRAPALRAALETIVTMVGGFIAFLMIGRRRRHGRGADVAIAVAFILLSVEYPLFIALPTAVASGKLGDVGRWTYLVVTACAAGLLSWASGQRSIPSAVEPSGALDSRGGLNRFAPVYTVTAAALASFVLLLYLGFDPDATVARHAVADQPLLIALPGVSAVRLVCFVLFAGAAIRFSSTRFSADDNLTGWLSVGCMFIAVGNLDQGLYPTVVPGELHLGDVFRLAGFLVFAVGATAEIHSYWYESRQLARLQERRNVARELHDSIAQELAFLRTQTFANDVSSVDAAWLSQLQAAADRALAESRRAIAALATDQPLTLSGDLEATVREAASRADISLELDIQPCSLNAVDMEVLVRIVREAVINAVRHARPTQIAVLLWGGDQPVLRVVDDGVGFDVETVQRATGGFGLVSMRERARSIGAQLVVRSRLGQGTTVEVSWDLVRPSES
jgi:signal transduction histidine kinase